MAKRVASIKEKRYFVEMGTPSSMRTKYAEVKAFAEVGQAVNAAEKFFRRVEPHLRKYDAERLNLVNRTIDDIRSTCFLVSNWIETSAQQRLGWTLDLGATMSVQKLRVEMWRI